MDPKDKKQLMDAIQTMRELPNSPNLTLNTKDELLQGAINIESRAQYIAWKDLHETEANRKFMDEIDKCLDIWLRLDQGAWGNITSFLGRTPSEKNEVDHSLKLLSEEIRNEIKRQADVEKSSKREEPPKEDPKDKQLKEMLQQLDSAQNRIRDLENALRTKQDDLVRVKGNAALAEQQNRDSQRELADAKEQMKELQRTLDDTAKKIKDHGTTNVRRGR